MDDPITLSHVHAPAIADLYHRCQDYFLLQDGKAASLSDAEELFVDVPDERVGDQIVLGWGNEAPLAALATILPDYPDRGIWYLGFLLVTPSLRGQGMGRAAYAHIATLAAASGARSIRLAVLEANATALEFWRSLGFLVRRRVGPDLFKTRRHHRIEFEVALPNPSAA